MSEAIRHGLKKTGWFRVAVSGETVDKRTITAQEIIEMAETYDPEVYGARINLDHIRGWYLDSEFKMYGDVLSVKSEEITLYGEKRQALFVQLGVTKDLVAINKKGQKIYSSIEMSRDFAGKGKAYLVGLACTDSPASLGTNVLQFSAQFGVETFKTDPHEADFAFSENEEIEEKKFSLKQFVADLFKEKAAETFNREDIEEAFSEIAKAVDKREESFTKQFNAQKEALESLREEFNGLKSQLEKEPASTQIFTPVVELGKPNDNSFGESDY